MTNRYWPRVKYTLESFDRQFLIFFHAGFCRGLAANKINVVMEGLMRKSHLLDLVEFAGFSRRICELRSAE